MEKRRIQFSPPDISDLEINEITAALRSGWITTGPRTKKFENNISEYCGSSKTVCLRSATAALETTLRVLGVKSGDEVITSAYTYTASASVINHVGAKIVLVDVEPNTYHIDYEKLVDAITEKTKVIIPVDIGGVMIDYEKIFAAIEKKNISIIQVVTSINSYLIVLSLWRMLPILLEHLGMVRRAVQLRTLPALAYLE